MVAIDSAVPRREEGTRTDDDMSASSMVSSPYISPEIDASVNLASGLYAALRVGWQLCCPS